MREFPSVLIRLKEIKNTKREGEDASVEIHQSIHSSISIDLSVNHSYATQIQIKNPLKIHLQQTSMRRVESIVVNLLNYLAFTTAIRILHPRQDQNIHLDYIASHTPKKC